MTEAAKLVHEFMLAMKEEMSSAPDNSVDTAHLLRRARLQLEETLELIEALGCCVFTEEGKSINRVSVKVEIDPQGTYDVVAAAGELADVQYINEGTALALGIPLHDVFCEVHGSNMTRIKPDGTLARHPKRIFYEGYKEPDIVGVLKRFGFQPNLY